MTTRTRRATAFLVPLGALVFVGLLGRSANPVAVADETTERFRAQAKQLKWEGVASCDSAQCHNRPIQGKRFTEARTWFHEDKHAKTYTRTLDSDRSRQIVKNLRRLASLAQAKPQDEALCLQCHSMNVPRELRGKKFSPDEGVGCESCHGPAGNWLADHQREPWKDLDDQAKEQRGFRPLKKSLENRAKVCVDCHVGSAEASVDHDLIAAGHPRLIFEFGAYHANLPKHWELADDKKDRPDFELRVWLTGQAATALAATELLEARAGSQKYPWPEFAEYDCFACHHNLSEPSWRRERGFGGRTPGSLSWGTWYFSMPRVLASQPRFLQPNLPQELDRLTKALTESLLNRDAALTPAGAVRKELQQWSDGLRKTGKLDATAARELLKALIDAGPQAARTDWESATQLYLALAAASDALSDLDPKHPAEEWKKALRDLFKQIDLQTRYDSPRLYTPKPIEARLEALRKRLK